MLDIIVPLSLQPLTEEGDEQGKANYPAEKWGSFLLNIKKKKKANSFFFPLFCSASFEQHMLEMEDKWLDHDLPVVKNDPKKPSTDKQ